MKFAQNQFAWRLWAIGLVLIVLGWYGIGSPKLGYVVFAFGFAGSILGWESKAPVGETPDETGGSERNSCDT